MANRITQYQSKAEVRPLQGSFAERTTPDKWLGVEYLPFGNTVAKAMALCVLAASTALAFVPVVAPTSADRWHPAIEQPFKVARTQYLAPSFFAPERQPVPRVDSWHPAVEQPQFDKKRNQYTYPSAFAPERQPQPRVDSWYQQASEPVRTGADQRVRWLGESDLQLTATQQPERVSVEKYDPGIQQPQFDKRRQQHTYEWSSFDPKPFPDTVYADRWWQLGNQPLFDVRHSQYLYPSYFGPDQQPKPALDSWFQPTSEPVRLGADKRIDWQGLSVLGAPPAEDVEEVTPDRWQPLGNQPQFDLKRNQHLYPSLFSPDQQSQPRLDSWFQPASEPVRLGDSRIQRLGASELDLTPAQDTERTTADKWLPLANQPQFDVRRAQYTFEFSFFNPKPFPSPVFADSWWQQASEPVRLPDRRIQAQGASEVALTPAEDIERASPDKWLPPIEQPLTRILSRAYLADLSSAPFTPRAVSVDSWFQQASEPVRLAPSRQHLSEFAVSGNSAVERVSADKWLPLGNQPQFSRARNQYLYPSHFGPERQPTVALDWFVQASEPVRRARPALPTDIGFIPVLERVTVDKWYQQPNQPLFAVRRAQYLYPSSFSPDSQPVPPVTSWWQLPNQPRFDICREQHLAASSILPELIRESLTIDKWWQQPNQPLFDRLRLQYGHQFSSFHPAPLPSEVGRASSSLSSASAIVSSRENSTAHATLAVQIAETACRLNSAEMVLSSASAIVTIDLISGN